MGRFFTHFWKWLNQSKNKIFETCFPNKNWVEIFKGYIKNETTILKWYRLILKDHNLIHISFLKNIRKSVICIKVPLNALFGRIMKSYQDYQVAPFCRWRTFKFDGFLLRRVRFSLLTYTAILRRAITEKFLT